MLFNPKSQPPSEDQVNARLQAEQDLALLRKQISSLLGAHGPEAYTKAGELLTEARRLTELIQKLS